MSPSASRGTWPAMNNWGPIRCAYWYWGVGASPALISASFIGQICRAFDVMSNGLTGWHHPEHYRISIVALKSPGSYARMGIDEDMTLSPCRRLRGVFADLSTFTKRKDGAHIYPMFLLCSPGRDKHDIAGDCRATRKRHPALEKDAAHERALHHGSGAALQKRIATSAGHKRAGINGCVHKANDGAHSHAER
jgi:hypothetical protein